MIGHSGRKPRQTASLPGSCPLWAGSFLLKIPFLKIPFDTSFKVW